MKTMEQLARDAGINFTPAGPSDDGIDTWFGDQYLPSGALQKFAALVLAEHSPAIIALARKLAMEEAALLCEKHVNNATDWDSSYWDQCAGACAHDIRAAASKGETP